MTAKFRCRSVFIALAVWWLGAMPSRALYYWDVNGSANGSGGPSPSGTWSATNPTWDSDDSGTATPAVYSQNSAVAFSAGTDATGSYTITVDNSAGQIYVKDMHADDGFPTLTGGALSITNGGDLISAEAGHVFTINCALQNLVNTTDALHIYKLGTVIFGASNTYHGSTTIEGGTLMLAGNQRIPATSDLILGNGDGRGSDGQVDTPATFNTGGFNQSLGMLILTGPNDQIARTIDFSTGSSSLSFSNSSAANWFTVDNASNSANPGPITLTIVNYSVLASKLRFGTNNTGLTPAQLSQITFPDYFNLPGAIDSKGYVTPAAPVFQSLQFIGQPPSQVQLTFTAVPGFTYEVDYTGDLSGGWQILGDYYASEDTIQATDSLDTQRFYRAFVVPQ